MLYVQNPLYSLLECLLTEEEGEDPVAAGFTFVASCEYEGTQENCLWFDCPDVTRLLNSFIVDGDDPTPTQWRRLHSLLLNKWPSLTLYSRFGCPQALFRSLVEEVEWEGQQKESAL
jgi:hypothetical protein